MTNSHKNESPVSAGLVVKISKSAATILTACNRFLTWPIVLYAMAFDIAACAVLVLKGGTI